MLKLLIGFLLFSAVHAAIVQEGVFIKDTKFSKIANSMPELVVDHVSSRGFELYGPKGTKAWLDQIGVNYSSLDKTSIKSLAQTSYPSHEEISSFLKTLASKYPKIMKLESIGKSVEGRELWMVKISDNVELDEVEPEFKYISSMHGDEITGRELTQFWIKDLLEGYGKVARITELVDNTEIFVMPSMNPDGSKRKRRGNAKWKDLNRDFPNWTKNEANSWEKRAPETQAVMKFQAKRQFSLSANFHGGAVVVNYPWDSSYDRHPLDELVKDLSLKYAALNPEMRSSTEFTDGVTNGADWYKVYGGMQDWSYFWHNDLQVTIELSDRKWPKYKDIPGFYKDNKESLFVFAKSIHQGAGFKLKASNSDGSVRVTNLDTNSSLGSFGFSRGEFYKVLEPGNYRFEIAVGNKTKSFETSVSKDNVLTNGNFTYL